ncbi:uncharacterized protein METZ01_LOCUS295494, partial [marine metagenome]
MSLLLLPKTVVLVFQLHASTARMCKSISIDSLLSKSTQNFTGIKSWPIFYLYAYPYANSFCISKCEFQFLLSPQIILDISSFRGRRVLAFFQLISVLMVAVCPTIIPHLIPTLPIATNW